MRISVVLLVLLSFAAAAAVAVGAPPAAPAPRKARAPYPKAKGLTAHAPYESGECGTCHKREGAKEAGALLKQGAELCYRCHDEIQAALKRSRVHAPVKKDCLACHNPHNSPYRKLLVTEQTALCQTCHDKTSRAAAGAKVKHDAVTHGNRCMNCHNPHASDVDHLLAKLPFDLCVECHAKDNLVDHDGRRLAGMKKILDENREWHAPVAAKDCSACHNPHGNDRFRLLTAEYPAQFYASYDPKNYALCFECHNPEIAATPKTTTLTRFRDGDRNMHYLHINRADRGRTCRACHGVHAANKPHLIRDGVPYGSKGWVLKIRYVRTPTGGVCEKSCHGPYTYDNGGPSGTAGAKGKKK
ncbi:MAG TPA: cytochrome c3 family protein [Polyangia bacterium]|jgi:predicted CXXCH cytochrome family protein